MLVDINRDDSVPDSSVLANLMVRRRSVRQLRHGTVTSDALHRIVEAARHTPAAYNRPPWRVVVIHDHREAFWRVVETAFRARLDGDRLERYLNRLAGFRTGVGAVLVFEDRAVVDEVQAAQGIDSTRAQAFSEQALGMVQLALWLAVVAEGLATSLQHWESLVADAVADFLDLPADRYRLVVTMPIGYAVETSAPVRPPDVHQVVSFDSHVEGACCRRT